MLKAISGMAIVVAASQLIQLLAQPFLAQLYSPESFGEFAQALSFGTILSVVCTLQIHNYLAIVKDHDSKIELFAFGLQWVIAVGVLLAILMYLFSGVIFTSDINTLMSMLVISLTLILSFANLLKGLVVAESQFSLLAKYTITRSSAVILAQFALAKSLPNNGLVLGLMIGEMASQLLLVGARGGKALKFVPISQFIKVAGQKIKCHYNFMVIGAVQELFAVAVFMMPLYWVGRLYGAAEGGQFSMAQKMTWAPVMLLTQAISPVLYKHFAGQEHEKLLASRFNSLANALLILVALIYPAAFCAEYLFQVFFGEVWASASHMAFWLSAWALTFLLAFPCRLSYRVLGYQKWQLFVDVFVLVLMLMLCMLHNYIDALEFVVGMSIIGILQNIGLLIVLSGKRRWIY